MLARRENREKPPCEILNGYKVDFFRVIFFLFMFRNMEHAPFMFQAINKE